MLQNKIGLIIGVANENSIAWKVAEVCCALGAKIIISCQKQLHSRAEVLAKNIGALTLHDCDVSNSQDMELMIRKIKEEYKLDFVVHSVAFSKREELSGRFIDTSQENFIETMNISCYSFIRLAGLVSDIMNENSSIITMSYYGAQKAIPNYNVMGIAKAALEASVRYAALDLGVKGIRVNAVSPGPIKTLAASAISGFRDMIDWVGANSLLRRNVTAVDVGNTVAYLASDLSTNVTGQVIMVDCGYSSAGMKLS